MLLDSGQRTSCVLPTDQLGTTVPLIADKQETSPIFHAYITGWGSQGRASEEKIVDNRGQINRLGFWVFQFRNGS